MAPEGQTAGSESRRAGSLADLLPLDAVRAIALVFLAAKLVLLVVQRPFMDETYYFLWGQHPALSYYDHPSLVGWTEGLSGAVFGWNVVALRFPVLLTLIGDLGFLYLFARRLDGENWRARFWLSMALFLSMPIPAALTGTAVPDHLMIFAGVGATFFFYRFLAGLGDGMPRWRWLYAGAAMAGLAILSKYYGALIGAGFLAAVLVTPRYQRLFSTPHLYLAAALVIAVQAPVLLWNVETGFASFRFIFASRQGSAQWGLTSGLPGYLIGIAIALSPFLVWPAVKFVGDAGEAPARVGRAVTALSTLLFLAASFVTNTIIHWNALAYVAPAPFLGAYIRSRALLICHFIYGAVVFGLIACNYALVPLVALVGQGSDEASVAGYGTGEVAAEVAKLKASNQADFVAGTGYAVASELAFALHDRNVVSLSTDTEAFDFWTDYAALKGQTAILVADRYHPLSGSIRGAFTAVEPGASVDVTAVGKPIDRYTIYIARGFSGLSQP